MSAAGQLAERVAGMIKDHNTHATLPAACAAFGMPEKILDDEGSKRDRVLARLAGRNPLDVAVVAELAGRHYRDMGLEEAALKILEEGDIPLTEITRRDLARCLDKVGLAGELALTELLVVRRRRLVPSPWPLTVCVRRRGHSAAGYLPSASDH